MIVKIILICYYFEKNIFIYCYLDEIKKGTNYYY